MTVDESENLDLMMDSASTTDGPIHPLTNGSTPPRAHSLAKLRSEAVIENCPDGSGRIPSPSDSRVLRSKTWTFHEEASGGLCNGEQACKAEARCELIRAEQTL
jgi:hypothetical protein